MSTDFEQAKTFFLEGIQHFEACRYAEAEQSFEASLARLPGRASTLTNLGAVRLQLGNPQSALESLEQSVVADPADPAAWGHHGEALLRLGRDALALDSYARCIALDPANGKAWSRQGAILKQLGRPEPAIASLQKAIELGADLDMNGFLLASLEPGAAPVTAPRVYVQSLFDSYADDFDEHLVHVLHYQAHTMMVDQVERLRDGPFASTLDLGCGTGLCAPLLRPFGGYLEGVDVSARMVERARAAKLYNDVVLADIVEHLASTEKRHELVTAADVFIYIGDLAPAFAGVRRVLLPGGLFAFSVERADGEHDFILQPRLTFAHTEAYLRHLAADHGFEVLEIKADTIREDQGQPIAGLYATLRRTA